MRCCSNCSASYSAKTKHNGQKGGEFQYLTFTTNCIDKILRIADMTHRVVDMTHRVADMTHHVADKTHRVADMTHHVADNTHRVADITHKATITYSPCSGHNPTVLQLYTHVCNWTYNNITQGSCLISFALRITIMFNIHVTFNIPDLHNCIAFME